MAKIPQQFIDDLLTRIDIVDVVDRAVPLKKKGANYSARCPFHNEKTPSFSVSQPKQFYYCFGCGASGNAIGFLMNHDGLTFVEAVKHLASSVGMEVPQTENDEKSDERRQFYAYLQTANDFYQHQLREYQPAIEYLKQRGLTGKIAKLFQIGYAPEGWDNISKTVTEASQQELIDCGLLVKNDKGRIYDRFRHRVMFPIRDRQGRTIGFGGRVLDDSTPKYLNSPENSVFHKGSELYGLYEAQKANRQLDELIVVEGYMDVIALAQHGVSNAVATLGTATTKQNAERLFRYVDNVVFSFDGDKAGRTAAWRAMENILSLLDDGLNVRFLFLPDGEDPDSMVRTHGKDGFLQAVAKQSLSCAEFLLKHLSDAVDLNSLEGRSKFAKSAEPYIKQIPGKIFQQLMIDELAKRSQMDANQLRELFGLPRFKQQNSAPKPTLNKQQTIISPMQQVISLIVQQPSLVEKLDNITQYQELTLPGSDLLNELLSTCQTTPELSTGALLSRWPDPKTQKFLSKLASRELLLSNEAYLDELNGLCVRLRKLDIEQKLNSLQQKMEAGQLSNTEKRDYQSLLQEQSR